MRKPTEASNNRHMFGDIFIRTMANYAIERHGISTDEAISVCRIKLNCMDDYMSGREIDVIHITSANLEDMSLYLEILIFELEVERGRCWNETLEKFAESLKTISR